MASTTALVVSGGVIVGEVVEDEVEKGLTRFEQKYGQQLANYAWEQGSKFFNSETFHNWIDGVKEAVNMRLRQMGQDTFNDALAIWDVWWADRYRRRALRRSKRHQRRVNRHNRRFGGKVANNSLHLMIEDTLKKKVTKKPKRSRKRKRSSSIIPLPPTKRVRTHDLPITVPLPRPAAPIRANNKRIRLDNMVYGQGGAQRVDEIHFKDGSVDLKAYKNNTAAHGFLLLNSIDNGNGEGERAGNSCHMTKVHLKLKLTAFRDVDGSAGPNSSEDMKCRVALVWDKHPNGVQATASEIYNSIGGDITSDNFNNLHYKSRFRIIATRSYVFRPQRFYSGTGGEEISDTFADSKQWNVSRTLKADPTKYIDDYLTIFNGTGGGMGDIQQGALYLVCTGTGADATNDFVDVDGAYRIRFKP